MEECIFCKIANHQQKTDIVFENEQIIVFKDMHPQAKVHLLIVPKKHIESINYLEEEDRELINQMIFLAKSLAKKQGIAVKGYRLFFNVGRGGGQIIDHLHLHLMGGGGLSDG
ncbi:MAG: histidine triad nucleotide-binding protein [Parcubacteria group bacterium]|jgi:histidine triad (HIT) family protein|nr:histidine triad nucleotide-binding protein [Parcubacteria group bacterium]|tara:strand:+ start:2259 stop:2597 length:339 start_codon:yes stop_codon:yes gene_type:complete